MAVEIKAPSPGESIAQVVLASWLVADGALVALDAEIAEIESDKATLMVFAPIAGILKITVPAGTTVNVGEVIGRIDAHEAATTKVIETKTGVSKERIMPASEVAVVLDTTLHITPLAKKIVHMEHVSNAQLQALSKSRIKKADVDQLLHPVANPSMAKDSRPTHRIKMSPLRLKLAERLVSVRNETAMLTTFNEVDMSAIMELRKQYGEAYKTRYGGNIGFLSFFVMAVQRAFAEFPVINASIEGDEIVHHDYADICIAVSTPKGLLAPAIRDVQQLSLVQIDQHIRDFGARALHNKITLDELRGGTFTITNGGTFGSMMSTPLINPPQSAILGMHKISDRAVALDGKVVIRPMMYIALSYDHRLIDGKESVGFIVKVKEYLEHPLSLAPHGMAAEVMLGLS